MSTLLLPEIKYNKRELKEFVMHCVKNNKPITNVDDSYIVYDSDFNATAYTAIRNQISLKGHINFKIVYLKKGINFLPHIDNTSNGLTCKIIFPITGDFEVSPIDIYNPTKKNKSGKAISETDAGEKIGSIVYRCPILLDTTIVHGVDNSSGGDRIVLSMCFHNTSFNDLAKMHYSNNLIV